MAASVADHLDVRWRSRPAGMRSYSGCVGAEVVLGFLLVLTLVTVAGVLLIRGQGVVRGGRFWLGIGLMLAGSLPLMYALLIIF